MNTNPMPNHADEFIAVTCAIPDALRRDLLRKCITGFPNRFARLLVVTLLLAPAYQVAAQQTATAAASQPATAPYSVEDEVLDNLRAQQIGARTIADLSYPEDFLRRVADRIIRESFERRFRIVVDEEEKPATQPAPPQADLKSEAVEPTNLIIHFAKPPAASIPASGPTSPGNRFKQTAPAFHLATECGDHDFAALRLQLTRASDWSAPGDGGALDIARQLMTRFDLPTVIHVESKFLPQLNPLATKWAQSRKSAIVLLAQDEPVAQWAQDNAKAGWIVDAAGQKKPTWLLPAFATRGDIGGADIPGESLAAGRLSAAGASVLRSSLLFQGGNLLCTRNPRNGKRLLLVGEAEIARNLQWGWTPQEIISAFHTEMSVEHVVVLPAISYHIDLELNVRAVGDRMVAFVVDSEAGRRLVLTAGVAALRAAGLLDQTAADSATAALAKGQTRDFMNIVGPVILGHALEFGAYPKTLADKFSTGPADSGVGNLLLFLHAMDGLLALSLAPEEVPQDRPGGFLRAIRRSEQARLALHKQLAELGFEVVKVPAISNGERGINPINCLHARRAVWIPVWGGLFADFDKAAIAAYRAVLDANVEVIPIFSSESQRRGGGLHCAVSATSNP